MYALRSIAIRNLKRLGYSVLEASGSAEALTLWNSHKESIDLVLSDMVMPGGMSGLELIHTLRAQQPSLPALIMSRYSQDLVTQGQPDPSIGFLMKPFNLPAISAAIRTRLDAARGAHITSAPTADAP